METPIRKPCSAIDIIARKSPINPRPASWGVLVRQNLWPEVVWTKGWPVKCNTSEQTIVRNGTSFSTYSLMFAVITISIVFHWYGFKRGEVLVVWFLLKCITVFSSFFEIHDTFCSSNGYKSENLSSIFATNSTSYSYIKCYLLFCLL